MTWLNEEVLLKRLAFLTHRLRVVRHPLARAHYTAGMDGTLSHVQRGVYAFVEKKVFFSNASEALQAAYWT